MSIDATESTDTTAGVVDTAADESVVTDVATDDSAASDDNAELETSQEAKLDDEQIDLPEGIDPFAEFNDKPLTTAEAVKAAFPRVPDSARERILDYGTKLDAALNQINEIGGEPGIALAREIAPVLHNPAPSKEEVDGVFQALSDTNPALVVSMSQLLLDNLLSNEKTSEDTANKLIEAEFGEGITLDLLHKYIGLHKAGMFDLDEVNKAAEGMVKSDPYREQLEGELKKANERIASLEGKTSSSEQSALDEAKAKSDSYVSDQLMAPIVPIAEKVGWVVKDTDKPEIKTAKIRLAELVTAYVEREARGSAEYRRYEQLRDAKQTFGPDGKPSRMLDANVSPLKAKTQALFIETVRELQPLINDALRYKSTPRNVNKTSEAATNGNGAKPAVKPAVVDTSQGPKFDPKAIDRLDQQLIASRRDAQIKVGQR